MKTIRYINITQNILIKYEASYASSQPLSYLNDQIEHLGIKSQYDNRSYYYNGKDIDYNGKDIVNNTKSSGLIFVNNKLVSLSSNYNDYDHKLTNTNQSAISPSPDGVIFDKFTVYFRAGYTIQDVEGLCIEISTLGTTSNLVLCLQRILQEDLDATTILASPLLINESLWTRSITIAVPSIGAALDGSNSANINLNESGAALDSSNSANINLIESLGVTTITNGLLSIKLYNLLSSSNIAGHVHYSYNSIANATISQQKKYNNLQCIVEESTNGDFFELYGKVDNYTFVDWLSSLSRDLNNIILFHEIKVKETLPGQEPILTTSQTITQSSNFDKPILFRPVILNAAHAVSFSLEYTLRIFDKISNTQEIKTSTLVYNRPKKYGQWMTKLNMGDTPVVTKIVNKITTTPVHELTKYNDTIDNIKYVTLFKNSNNIKVNISTVKLSN